MADRKYFVKGEELIATSAPRDHVQFTHEGYQAFDGEDEAKGQVTKNKAAATRAATRAANQTAAAAPRPRKASTKAASAKTAAKPTSSKTTGTGKATAQQPGAGASPAGDTAGTDAPSASS